MELTGQYELNAKPEEVWKALFDLSVLEKAIPGCEYLETIDQAAYVASVKLKIGPVSARFKGRVSIEDAQEYKRCQIVGSGSGGIAGFAKGSSSVLLTETEQGTMLSYNASAAVGGKLAALGNRLIQSTSRKLADQFFANFAAELNTRKECAQEVT